jgi:hypothetical protein
MKSKKEIEKSSLVFIMTSLENDRGVTLIDFILDFNSDTEKNC